MNKENKLVPKLRFPEFQGSRDWKLEPFSEIYRFFGTNSFTRDNLNYKNGNIKNIHYGDIHTKFDSHFDVEKETVPFVNADISVEKIKEDFFCKEGDVVFADASEDLNDIGKSIEIINTNEEKIISGLHTLLARPRVKKLYIGFGGHLFKSPSIRTQIQKEAQGAKVLGISATRLSNILVYYPENKTEQQKIASCLSSLDELITAHTDKLDALRDHKKGLMQQLFPAEGETLPKLRFKEFEKDGEWVETKISSIGYVVTGSTPSKDDGEFWDGDFVWITAQDFKDKYISNSALKLTQKGKNKSRIIPTDSVLVTCIASIGLNAINKIECATNQQINAIVCNDNNFFEFIYYVIEYNKNRLKNLAGQTAVPIINKTVFESFEIKIPKVKAEQQKIANFLSSIDDEITAQTQKIEALKEHKKGLMQGLFPVINE